MKKRKMKMIQTLLGAVAISAAALMAAGPASAGDDGILLRVRLTGDSNYCHLKFPAIREDTLSWDRPVLKAASSGDIVDFYGPCNHNPLGRDEILRQRAYLQREYIDSGD